MPVRRARQSGLEPPVLVELEAVGPDLVQVLPLAALAAGDEEAARLDDRAAGRGGADEDALDQVLALVPVDGGARGQSGRRRVVDATLDADQPLGL